jgi:hypothetical protein
MRIRSAAAIVVAATVVVLGLGVSTAAADNDPVAADPDPSVLVTPATGLVDGSAVHVTVAGALPLGELFASVCAAGAVTDPPCQGTGSLGFTIPASGVLEFDLVVEAVLRDANGATVDCRVAPGCALVVLTQRADGAVARIVTPLGFRADGPLRPPPALTVDPATDLVDGQTVQVTGRGFLPTAGIVLWQCRTPFTSPADCGPSLAILGVAADGTLSTPVVVAEQFVTAVAGSETQVDCRAVQCAIVATRGLVDPDPRSTAVAPIEFQTPEPPPPAPPPPHHHHGDACRAAHDGHGNDHQQDHGHWPGRAPGHGPGSGHDRHRGHGHHGWARHRH